MGIYTGIQHIHDELNFYAFHTVNQEIDAAAVLCILTYLNRKPS